MGCIKGNCSYVWYLQRRSIFGEPESFIVLHSIKLYTRTWIRNNDEGADFQIDTASPLECRSKGSVKGSGMTTHMTEVIFVFNVSRFSSVTLSQSAFEQNYTDTIVTLSVDENKYRGRRKSKVKSLHLIKNSVTKMYGGSVQVWRNSSTYS